MSGGLRGAQLKLKRLGRIYDRLDSDLCFFCNSQIGSTIDHFIPKKLGGTNEEWNLVAACDSCNNKKGANLPTKEFIDKWINLFDPPKEIVNAILKRGKVERFKITFDICEIFNISSYELTIKFERAARNAGMKEEEIKKVVKKSLKKDRTYMLKTILEYCKDNE